MMPSSMELIEELRQLKKGGGEASERLAHVTKYLGDATTKALEPPVLVMIEMVEK